MVYASEQTIPFSAETLRILVEQSRVRNAQHGITAVLLHQHGTFLHGLEGEAEEVRALFNKVSADPRHHDVQPLVQIEVGQRLFAGQSMGFYDAVEDEMELGDLEPSPLDPAVYPHQFSWRACIALRLLARFRS